MGRVQHQGMRSVDFMKILSIDPSCTRTGYAITEGEPGQGGKLIAHGHFVPPLRAKTNVDNVVELFFDVRSSCFQHEPDVILVELPFQKPLPPKLQSKRNTLHLPWYGVAVGAALAAAVSTRADSMKRVRVFGIPNDTWAARYPAGKEAYKAERVRTACEKFEIEPKLLGPKTTAGDIADALLMAYWFLSSYPSCEQYSLLQEA